MVGFLLDKQTIIRFHPIQSADHLQPLIFYTNKKRAFKNARPLQNE